MTLQTELKLYLPIPLTEKQKAELGEQMSKVEIEINQLEIQKKNTVAAFTEKIKDLESELYGLAKKFEENTEQIEVDCRVEFNTPERGKKTIIRLDTNSIARVEDMSEFEIKAIEQPDLFEKDIPLEEIYGFDPDDLCIDDDFFIADDFDKTNEFLDRTHNSVSNEEYEKYKNCLFVHAYEDDIDNFFNDNSPHVMKYVIDEEEAWFVFKTLSLDFSTSSELNNDYKIPENVEDGADKS